MGKLYDESLVSEIISEIGTISSNIDSCYQQLQSIVSSDGYYAKNTSGLHNISNLLDINSDFSDFMNNAKNTYDLVCAEMKSNVDSLEGSNVDIIFDAYISNKDFITQTSSGDINASCSVVNALISNFGITGKENISALLEECNSFSDKKSGVTGYLLSNERNDKYTILNSIKDNNNIEAISIDGDNNYNLEDGKVYLGQMQFSVDTSSGRSYEDVLTMIEDVYNENPNATITFYGMVSGGGTAFGPASNNNRNVVTMEVNVKEFMEDGTIYILDSNPRLISSVDELSFDTNTTYNFVDSNSSGMKSFNEIYTVSREIGMDGTTNDNVLKVQLKDGETFNSENLYYLGLNGSVQVLINTTPSYDNNTDIFFNEKLEENLTSYNASIKDKENTTYILDESVKDGKMLEANYEGREYYIANTSINCFDYQEYIEGQGLMQCEPYYVCSNAQCMVLCQYYAVDMLAGTKSERVDFSTKYSDIKGGYDDSPGTKINNSVASESLDIVLDYVYDELSAGRPVVLQVSQQEEGKRHLVLAVGYAASVDGAGDLNEDTILVLDCYDGQLQTLSKSRDEGGHERELYNWKGNYQAIGAEDWFLDEIGLEGRTSNN